jgi:hypothetical protein
MYGSAPPFYPPPRRGAGQQLIYLDFDGPMHHNEVYWRPKRGPYFHAEAAGHRFFEHAPLLEAALQAHPNVKIVLSTSWVRVYGCGRAAKKLPPALCERVIGATFHRRMNRQEFEWTPRGQQIWDDVGRRRPAAWVALDDDVEGWPAACLDNLIAVDGATGLGDPAVLAELTRRLDTWRGLGEPFTGGRP